MILEHLVIIVFSRSYLGLQKKFLIIFYLRINQLYKLIRTNKKALNHHSLGLFKSYNAIRVYMT